MDQHLPIVTKKIWKIMRVAFYLLKKNINKKKILLDLNLFIKRGKFVAEKTLTNLIYHHHNNHQVSTTFEDEYEFSCTNTPLYRHYLTTVTKPKNKNKNKNKTPSFDLDQAMWDLVVLPKAAYTSPVARRLRVTDSPYPLQNEGGDHGVDAAAEEFIKKFYSQLKQQA